MKGSRYYKNLDFSKPVGTHRYVDNIKDRRQLAKVCLVAMARINQAEQGTITEPYELASSTMKDGRTLIQTIYENVRSTKIWNISWTLPVARVMKSASRLWLSMKPIKYR